MNKNRSIKIGYVLSYRDNEYIRTRTLLSALGKIDSIKVYPAINKQKNIFRYFETLFKLIQLRIKHNPDIYILGFRGFEIYWPIRFLTLGKKLIFDEFVNSYHWTTQEHRIISEKNIFSKLLFLYNKLLLKTCSHILTDTPLLKDYLAKTFNINPEKITSIFVSTDESTFNNKINKNMLREKHEKNEKAKELEVFFYSNFLPLHGVDILLKAAKLLEGKPIHFTIAGGKGKALEKFLHLKNELNLQNVTHYKWIEYNKLPEYISNSDICIGGPLADTPQARIVITGKAFQFLSMGKATLIGKNELAVGFVNHENCLLVGLGSEQEVANELQWALDHEQMLPKIGEAGKKLYANKFSNAKIAEDLNKVIINL